MTYVPLTVQLSQRKAVVAEARSWVGTKYHHCADVKGVGVDCAMLLVRVFVDTGLVPPFDPRPYPPDWHFHRDDERYIDNLMGPGTAHEVTEDDVMPGDVVLWKCGRTHSHGAIIVDWSRKIVVQALAIERLVIEGPPPDYLMKRAPSMRFFSFWGATP